MNKARTFVVASFVVMFFGILTYKLFSIQISNHENYKFLAQRQQNQIKEIKAERGTILASNNEVLAYTKEGISYYVDLRMMNSSKKSTIAKKFSQVFGKTEKHYLKLMSKTKGNVCLESKTSKDNSLKLEDFVVDGLFSKEENTRIYPYGKLASHIIGYVNTESEGVAGIEKVSDEYLSGKDGAMLIGRDVRGRTVSIDRKETSPEKDGNNIQLTINKIYQSILEKELKKGVEEFSANAAIGILMDPATGAILGLANYPDFEPAKYFKYNDDSRRNRALTDIYEPGSTLKSVILSAIMNENIVKSDDLVNTENGFYKFHNVSIRDEHKFEQLTVREVLEQSSNIGMAKISQKMNNNLLYKYLRDFGFGNYTSIELPGEADGKLKKPNSFTKVTKASISRGYSIAVTPIQMASAYSALVNGGVLYKPYIIKKIMKPNGDLIKEQSPLKLRNILSDQTSNRIKNIMFGVVENGTGKSAKLRDITVGGKTGTAKKIIDNEYASDIYNSSFVGFFPVKNPKVVCYVLVDSPSKGRFGGASAAPIFRRVAEQIVGADVNIIPDKEGIKEENKLFERIIAETENYDDEVLFSDIDELETGSKKELIDRKTMPHLHGKALREAAKILTAIGVDYKISGNGKVFSQSIPPGTKLKSGMVCELKCKSSKYKTTLRLN